MLKHSRDQALDVFDDGCLVLRRDGDVAGHVATSLGTFWSPSRPLTMQQWVWLIVVWADGEREVPMEDYPPWSVVAEIRSGTFIWDDGPHAGTYSTTWLPVAEAEAKWEDLGISRSDF